MRFRFTIFVENFKINSHLEPDSLRTTVGTILVECFGDDEASSPKHGPPCMNEFICLVSEIKFDEYLAKYLSVKKHRNLIHQILIEHRI
jgi:hypothetical protein